MLLTSGFASVIVLLNFVKVEAWPIQNSSGNGTKLPVVDLGYSLHQAGSFNESGRYYNFSNIRYAAPPVGNLRFKAPQAPATDRSQIDDGSVGRICPQAGPEWELIAEQFIPEYLKGKPVNITIPSGGGEAPALDPRTTEDCLFLDVLAPKSVFECEGKGAPVLVWIYGGGYVAGDKTGTGNAAGLIHRSNDSIVYVALNYRLGAFGWLSGPTFQEDGTANAGLWDQRFALHWIQKNIRKFGGDPDQVTVIGESAGGGSIMHQITAFGGNLDSDPDYNGALFDKAIMQSPGFLPIVSNRQQETTLDNFLALLNVSSIQEARQLPTEALIRANIIQVADAPYGSFLYGPAVDGDFVPDLPGTLLLHGQFDTSVKVMVGHNADEGLLFSSPYNVNETEFEQNIRQTLPTISDAVLKYITTVLYPQVYDGTYGYTDPIGRVAVSAADLGFVCNTRWLDVAFKNETYAYHFTIPPALHGQDTYYTFYNDGGLDPDVESVQAALALQDWIVTFTKTGVPTTPDVPTAPMFPIYGPDSAVVELGLDSITIGTDDAANSRCDWWQKALYL